MARWVAISRNSDGPDIERARDANAAAHRGYAARNRERIVLAGVRERLEHAPQRAGRAGGQRFEPLGEVPLPPTLAGAALALAGVVLVTHRRPARGAGEG